MPWILDGNNVAHGGERSAVRSAALDFARGKRMKVVVIFDGAPPDGGREVEHLGPVEVRYAPVADSAILEIVERGGREWRLVTDDRDLARKAHERGAQVTSVADFRARLSRMKSLPEAVAGVVDLDRELAYFRDSSRRLPRSPARVRRRRGGGR
jgi:YacP-like NYN domain